MSAANKLLGDRYQFIQVLGSTQAGQTLLVADVHYPGHPKCVLRQVRLPTRNPMTLKFILRLLEKKVEVLQTIGQHRQIPSTFSSFEANQSFYLAQEFIPGRSLKEELVPGQPFPEHAVLSLLRESLTVLAFAQEHGVIHGSLKPSKIIRHQTDQRLVILDFGLIKDISQNMTSKEVTAGSAKALATHRVYVAAEQRSGRPRFCTDHYALGMIAIQALTGLPVEELPDASHPNAQQSIISLLQSVPNLGLNTASLLARMVHPNPDRRYQKAVEILADLERLKDPQVPAEDIAPGTPILTETEQPTTLPKQWPLSGKQMRRKWIGGVAIAGIVVLGLAVTLKVPQRFLVAQQVKQAKAAEARQDYATAIAHYTQALELYPNHPQLLADRGQLAFDQGDTEAALADLTKAIELDPNNQMFTYTRGNFRFNVGDTQGAIEDYTRAIQQDGNFIRAFVNRGSARAAWGDDKGAVEDYTQALNLDPPLETKAATYLNRCLSYSNLGDQTLALEDCSEAISLRPSHALAYQNRGLVRRRLGDLQGALQDYNIAIQIDPKSPDPYYNRGLTRQAMNDLTGAMSDFSQALTIQPDYVFALYDRGLLNAAMGQSAAAIADFQKASQVCLELGRTGCYEDALYQIAQLQATGTPETTDPAGGAEGFNPP